MDTNKQEHPAWQSILIGLDLEPTDENWEHLLVFAKCMKLYEERNKSYGPVWKRYGAVSNLLRAAAKIDRLMESWWFNAKPGENPALHKDNLDDAYDLINYATFFIRSATQGNLVGAPTQRPEVPEQGVLWDD